MKNNKTLLKIKKKNKRGFFAFLVLIAESIARFFKRGPVGFFFAELYTKCNEKWKNGFIYNLFRKRKQKIRERATFSHVYEKSLINKKISRRSRDIIHSQLREWGVAMLFFALSIIASNVLRWFIDNGISFEALIASGFAGFFEILSKIDDPEIYKTLVLGTVVVGLSIPLIISKKELGEFLITNKLTRFVMIEVLNLNPIIFERKSNLSDNNYLSSSILAIFIGAVTYQVRPIIIILLLFALALFLLTATFPEIGTIFLIIILPFANLFPSPYQTTILLMILGFTLFGFVFKLLRAKRVLRFELIDVLVMAFGVLLFFGGIFTHGDTSSFWSAEIYFAFFLIYFLIVSMYIGKPSIYRAFKILAVTATFVSIVGIIKGGVLDESTFDSTIFSDMPGRVSAFLGNPNILGAYLAIIFPIVLGLMVVSKRIISKVMYFISGAFVVVCTIMTGSRGAWLGMIAATAIFLIVYNFKNIWIVITSLSTVPLGIWLFGEKLSSEGWFVNRLSTTYYGMITALGNTEAMNLIDSSISYRLTIWGNVVNMIGDHFFSGVGVGEHAFRFVYENYLEKGEYVVAHAHSLILQIFVSLGIVGLVIFLLIMFTYGQQCFVEIKRRERNSKSRTMIIAGLASMSGAFVVGLTDYIWYNYRVFILFWIVMAVTVALVRNNARERESTKMISNMTSANIDINC